MKLFDKVAVVGTGLIGGSMALGIKKKKLAGTVIGVSRHKETLVLAKKNGAIDFGSTELEAVKEADLVILATPVNTILETAEEIAKLVKPGCIVTDVGSTKAGIVLKLSNVFARFIGSHPLAGSEKRGISNAEEGLFKNSLCIITPVKKSDPQALKKIQALWKALGSKVVLMEPQVHDRILSFVSHLPHVIAFSLIESVPSEYLRFSPNSLKDMTRVASSDPNLWADIFLSNNINTVKALDSLRDRLFAIRQAVDKKDKKTLVKIISRANKKREILK
ncbi:MAG: prephenate dehydrogenase/arogenate dehydrogenase family protein [Candidatus Omnitrophica bacterium]|nr:prephenate dehydrogenase/arogenate dehydrogenase family protein [Candidatus Omnitrophota bacterium]